MSTTMVADAVALTESGVLVNGLCVTDLLSGLEVRGEDIEDTADTGDASPVFRGSGVPLRRLESVRELVEEVLEARAVDPELTSANPVVPRTVFPWGIGAQVSDVLVVGPDKEATAAYLRISGLRARTVDVGPALRLAGDLAAARAELEDPAPPEPEPVQDVPRRRGLVLSAVGATAVAAVTTIALVSTGVVGGGAADVAGAPETAQAATQTPDAAPPEASGASDASDTVEEPEAEAWREMSSGGEMEYADHPDAPQVTVDVPGWEVTESTAERDIWTSGDAGMRVLLAATPTPVGTQGELDTAMLRALDGADDVVVTNRSPVSYEEHFPDSTTSWRVRLVDGHQVSVGCQYRDLTEDRQAVCDRFGATARVLLAE